MYVDADVLMLITNGLSWSSIENTPQQKVGGTKGAGREAKVPMSSRPPHISIERRLEAAAITAAITVGNGRSKEQEWQDQEQGPGQTGGGMEAGGSGNMIGSRAGAGESGGEGGWRAGAKEGSMHQGPWGREQERQGREG